MNSFKYANLFVRIARSLAVFCLVGYTITGLALQTFPGFLLGVFAGAVGAFMIMVGADLVACFLQIEVNSRSSESSS